MAIIGYSLIAAGSLVIIMISASYIIKAAAHYARETGISDYLIGFLVLSIGTSLPELTTAFVASFNNMGQMILGDVIGANIIDVTVVLGLTAIVGRRIKIKGKVIEGTVFTILIMAMLPLIFGIDGEITRAEGMLLLVAFVIYILRLLLKEGEFGQLKHELKWKDIWQDMVVVTGCLVALLLSSNWLIMSGDAISRILGIPLFLTGLLLFAFGTTVPELTVELGSVLRGMTGIAFGDILGSVVANSSLVLGTAAIINPISTGDSTFLISTMFMITSVYIAILFIKKKEITWQEGIGLLMLYLTFLFSQGLANLF